MSRSGAVLRWLEDKSDWLSPIVVKEVRQMASGREFASSFGASVVAGLGIAFFGAADALSGSGTSGRWTFTALMSCLTVLGLVIVPLGAFSALRNERLEQTLELITLTALSSRRIVIGKLLAQIVKLGTLFAAMAPFIAMSFLLGGIDFISIVISLVILFMWSVWISASGLFLSSLFKTRAMLGLVFGGAAVALFLVFGLGRMLYLFATRAAFGGGSVFGIGVAGSDLWWGLAIMTTFCLVTMVNLVLLAENRLSLPTENRVTALRVGFLAQFLLIAAFTLPYIDEAPRARANALNVLGVIGGLHLAVVAMFTVTEDLIVSRRELLRMRTSLPWRWPIAMFHPGGGRGALYVLTQMALLLVTAWLFQPPWEKIRWFLAICGYICFFTGVPVFLYRVLRPAGGATLKLRIAVLALVPISLVVPDIVHYVLWQPDVLNLRYSARHLLNPFRTLANWNLVETNGWFSMPLGLGLAGLLSYLRLIHIGTRLTAQAAATDSERAEASAGEPGSANVLY
jgi:hypothetical protein